MRKYYTRACNFYHGSEARRLIQTKKALPLNGKNNIAFDSIEIFSREKRGVKINLVNINKIFKLNKKIRKIVKEDLIKIVSKRKDFLKNINIQSHFYYIDHLKELDFVIETNELPCIFIKKNKEYKLIINSDEMDNFNNVEELINRIKDFLN